MTPTTKAALWMLGAVISFAAMAIAGRELSADLNTFEIMAYRSAVGFPIVAALALATGATIRSTDPGGHVTRNIVHFTAQNFWFYGVAAIPLAQLVAIEFTNPIWVALLAPLLLGERLTQSGIVAVCLGFIGILIVARPGLAPLELGHGAALLAAIGFALTNIFTRRLREDGTLCILFWMTLSQAVMGFAIAIPLGLTLITLDMLPWTLFIGICGLTAHYSLTQALGLAPATIVAPMEFMRLPVIAIAAALLYGEELELAVFIGAVLIMSGNLFNLRAKASA